MSSLYSTFLMNWAPYSIEKTVIPEQDIKSSEYLFCCIIDAIRNHKPFSVVRMGDGEAGLMKFYKTNIKQSYMKQWWFDRVGITNATDDKLKEIGRRMIYTAEKTDFLGSSIWGSSKSDISWSIEDYINRDITMPRCSNWFNMEWISNGCAHALVSNFSFGILHNDP